MGAESEIERDTERTCEEYVVLRSHMSIFELSDRGGYLMVKIFTAEFPLNCTLCALQKQRRFCGVKGGMTFSTFPRL